MSETPLQTENIERPIPLDRDSEFLDNMTNLIRLGQRGMVMNLVLDMYEADLARLLPHLPFDEAFTLFHWLPEELASEVVAELDDEYRADLLEESPKARLAAIIDNLDTDDAADVLADLPDHVVEDVLPHLEDRHEVRELLRYEEDTAGGIMSTEFVAVHEALTIGDATEEVRRSAERVEPVYTVYVLDDEGHLEGLVPLKRLLLGHARVPVREVMETDILSVTPDIDQEEVARMMERYDLVALPVVDDTGRLLGRITIDDVVDVLREEAQEDIQRMSGITISEEPTASVFRVSQGRLAWLFLGLAGTLLSALVIRSFEATLTQIVSLAMFIPVVTAMAGNVGIQSSAIAVQGLATGDIWSSDLPRRMGKEFIVAFLNGAALAIILGFCVLLMKYASIISGAELDPVRLAFGVGLSLFSVILVSATIGAAVPLVLNRFNIDPAIASGPFITTLNDILGLVIYFAIASAIVLP